jgi:starch synthase
MHIVHITTEFATVAKVGGLGDVTYGLSLELARLGHQVTVILPKYDIIDLQDVTDFHQENFNYTSFFENHWYSNSVWTGNLKGVKLLFIDPQHPHNFFDRGMVYGSEDDINRFLYFSRSIVDLMLKREINPDVIHLHDWHTSAIAPLYRELQPEGKAKIVLTIHNLEYQGRCSPSELLKIGLDPSKYDTQDQLQDPLYPEAANFLKGGIINADRVTTVSPNYMKEIISPEGGKGLESVITKYHDKFTGILNGIDPDYWNPQTDPYLPHHFSAKKPQNKNLVKTALQEKLQLSQDNRPLVGVVSRLVPQKGIELIKAAIEYTLKCHGQFVLLGSSPIPEIQAEFEELKIKHSGNANIFLQLQHDEEIAHLIYAGADVLLMPSLFEPCGLSQIIALRYGTIPVVRVTGGLKDTISDQINGFTFIEPTTEALQEAMTRMFHCWIDEPFQWKVLMQNAMKAPFNWKESAKRYLELYELETADISATLERPKDLHKVRS